MTKRKSGCRARIRTPASGWLRIAANSPSVSRSALPQIVSAIASLPTSCRSAPIRRRRIRPGPHPSRSAIASASLLTREPWPPCRDAHRSPRRARPASPRLSEFKPLRPNPSSRLRLSSKHPPPDEAEDNRADHEQDDDRAPGDEAVAPDCLGGSLACEVGDEPDRDRPADAAGGIPGEEEPPMHLADARQPGCGHPQDRDEAPEEDRLRAVTREEALRPRKHPRGVTLQRPPPLQQLPPAEAA